MYELLMNIADLTLYLNVSALIIYQFVRPERTAFSTLLFGVCAMTFLQHFYQFQIEKLYGIKEYKTLVSILWYLGFAISDFIFVFLCIKFCNWKKLKKDRSSYFILFSYVALGAIQLIRYADRHIFDTRLLGEFYRVAIPTINIGVTLIILSFVVSVVLLALNKTLKGRY